VSAKADFAEYGGSYSLSNGVLKVERRLVIKKANVPVDAWADYRNCHGVRLRAHGEQ